MALVSLDVLSSIKDWLRTILIVIAALALVGPVLWLSGADHGRQKQILAYEEAQAIATQAAMTRSTAARIDSIRMAEQLAVDRERMNQLQQAIAQEASHVTHYIRLSENAPLEPLPDHLFTRGFVCDWNTALQPDLSSTGSTTAQVAACAKAPDTLNASNITEADILINHTANSLSCAATRQQLTDLIRWHRKYDQPSRIKN